MDMDSEQELLWLVLQELCQNSSSQLRKLLTLSSEPSGILAADRGQWRSAGVSRDTQARLLAWRRSGRAAAVLDAARSHQATLRACGARTMVLGGPDYPPLLAEIPDPPPLLFVRGNPALLCRPQLAIVGSRKTSSVGRRAAAEFARAVAEAGMAVTSGLALGIDAQAHLSALSCGGETLAVMATGIDRVYPRRHRDLARQIAEQGALLTEFPAGTGPLRAHFPQRNRLISGLSLGVLVVEAALPSGSLITARMALEQGREVFALPQSIYHLQGAGCNDLLRQGATLVQNVEDIFAELGALLEFCVDSSPSVEREPGLSPGASRILDQLGFEPVPLDELAGQLGLDVAALARGVMELEMAGLAEMRQGGCMRC